MRGAIINFLIARAIRSRQALTEYAMIIAFVGIVTILALTLLGSNITSVISSVANKI